MSEANPGRSQEQWFGWITRRQACALMGDKIRHLDGLVQCGAVRAMMDTDNLFRQVRYHESGIVAWLNHNSRREEIPMGKSGEFFTFDETLKRLSIEAAKLNRLVSEGEIRAFREGDQLKFRRTDVENLDVTGARGEEETGVIDLSKPPNGNSSEVLSDDLIFDEGDDLDLTSAEAGMQTAEISSQDAFVDAGSPPHHEVPRSEVERSAPAHERAESAREERRPERAAVRAPKVPPTEKVSMSGWAKFACLVGFVAALSVTAYAFRDNLPQIFEKQSVEKPLPKVVRMPPKKR